MVPFKYIFFFWSRLFQTTSRLLKTTSRSFQISFGFDVVWCQRQPSFLVVFDKRQPLDCLQPLATITETSLFAENLAGPEHRDAVVVPRAVNTTRSVLPLRSRRWLSSPVWFTMAETAIGAISKVFSSVQSTPREEEPASYPYHLLRKQK